MVSLQTAALATKERNTCNWFSIFGEEPSKKRKLCCEEDDGEVQSAAKELKLWSPPLPTSVSFVDNIELQLEEDSPLPPEWQRCLDIKSGRIHFYNTRTSERSTKVPRSSTTTHAPPAETSISLDLELNLGCDSPPTAKLTRHNRNDKVLLQEDTEPREMVAAACMRCHMLVMMSKSSPSCPNCKFLHETHVGSTPGSFVNPAAGFLRNLCGSARKTQLLN